VAAGWGEVSGRCGRGGEGRRGAGDDDAEAAAAQGGAIATTANGATIATGRGTTFLLRVDDDGGADRSDPRRILGGRGPRRRSILISLGAAREQLKRRRRLGLGSKPRRLIPCKQGKMCIMWTMYCNEPLGRYI
jgi:hypothetical protein